MRTGTIAAFVFAAGAALFAATALASAPLVSSEIRSIAQTAAHPYAAGASALEWTDLRRVYELSGWAPLWLVNGGMSRGAATLLEALRASGRDGLQPSDYATDRLAQAAHELGPGTGARDLALFDSALTLSVLRFASDLHDGRIDPRAAGFGSLERRPSLDRPQFVSTLARADDVVTSLRSLDPRFPIFARLRAALARMLELARSPVPVPDRMRLLRPGDLDPEVPRLRRLLATLGDLPTESAGVLDSQIYDPDLVAAVKSFQQRHGLAVDGVVGPATLRQIRVPPSERARQIELAMERLRWLAEPAGKRFIVVNIPEFRLLGFRAGDARPHLVMDVIVGKAARLHRTPVLRADMEAVIFRPYWNVPPGIARREILPLIARDPSYLARHRMEIVDGRVRQRPGDGNALGLIKFHVPNPYNVYLHDTPARELFHRTRRDFSHGCIRVADPPALAEFALAERPGWNGERIAHAMTLGKNNTAVAVAPPIPVYVLYSTAIVDSANRLHFYEDIYGHDIRLRQLLDAASEQRRQPR